MPFKSKKQRKWMWANKPDIAEKWTREGKGKIKSSKSKKK